MDIVLTEKVLISYIKDICNDTNYGFKEDVFIVSPETYDALIRLKQNDNRRKSKKK